ncbi:MAG TPA: phosphoribosyl-AMP cyclohydrolase [Nitrososphaerales archaeon]|nr:phosphoribosyl-AMP cyclohydrolase [Nitrososphaerales archaeon]
MSMSEMENHKKGISEFIDEIDFRKGGGIVPVVVQDIKSKDVLMLAYANREALSLSFSTGMAHYWSRSRASLWKKGETSGNLQTIKRIDTDCDKDTILYLVDQVGVACHRGTWSCFDSVKKESNE